MRDSLIAVMVVGGLVGSFVYLKSTGHLMPNIATPAELAMARVKSAPHPHPTTHKGEVNGPKSTRLDDQQAQDNGQDEGASDDASEIESIASIYQDKGATGRSRRVKSPILSEEREPKPAVIHGVPIAAWVRSRQDALPEATVPSDSGDGIRVFLQCMELKKEGPEALKERDCERLAASNKKNTSLAAVAGSRAMSPTDEYR
jgi:hypothetical protein